MCALNVFYNKVVVSFISLLFLVVMSCSSTKNVTDNTASSSDKALNTVSPKEQRKMIKSDDKQTELPQMQQSTILYDK
jgi:hypothetical protein